MSTEYYLKCQENCSKLVKVEVSLLRPIRYISHSSPAVGVRPQGGVQGPRVLATWAAPQSRAAASLPGSSRGEEGKGTATPALVPIARHDEVQGIRATMLKLLLKLLLLF